MYLLSPHINQARFETLSLSISRFFREREEEDKKEEEEEESFSARSFRAAFSVCRGSCGKNGEEISSVVVGDGYRRRSAQRVQTALRERDE